MSSVRDDREGGISDCRCVQSLIGKPLPDMDVVSTSAPMSRFIRRAGAVIRKGLFSADLPE